MCVFVCLCMWSGGEGGEGCIRTRGLGRQDREGMTDGRRQRVIRGGQDEKIFTDRLLSQKL